MKNQGFFNFCSISGNLSYIVFTRTMKKKIHWQKILWKFLKYIFEPLGAYLILDDTIIEKPYSEANNKKGSFIRYCYSNSKGQIVKGKNIVIILLLIGKLRILLSFPIYDKTKKKTELAL